MFASWWGFLLLTLFNAAVCLLLPRLVTLDRDRLLRRLKPETVAVKNSENTVFSDPIG
ncbi:hypothetical protein [Baaleninema sp.]|uniref:hypothetical protein n=1 Tax=Baaleninema sp. TaxID=3101197 RepID=UPI003D0448A5